MSGKYQTYPEYKESRVEWLGNIPNHWNVFDGKRVFKNRRELALDQDEQLAASQKYGVIPQSLMMKLNDSKVMLALNGTSSFRHVEKNDFVISLRSFEGGIEYSSYKGCVSPAYTVLNAIKDIASAFYRYLFKSKPFISALQSTTDSLRDGKSITYEQFGAIPLVLPSVFEQEAIANFLDHETAKIDVLIEKQQQLIQLLKEKRQVVISHAVTKGLHPNVPMRDSGVEWLGEIPEHWGVTYLTHLVDQNRRIMYGIVLPGPNVDDGVAIVKGGDVKPGRLNLDSLCKTTYEIESNYARSRLAEGDLVYSIRGTIGDVEIVPKEIEGANLTQDAARISPKKGVHNIWLKYVMESTPVFSQLEIGSLGAAVKGINIRDLKKAILPQPPESEMLEIADFIEKVLVKMNKLAENCDKQIQLLNERRTALISAAVTGKIDVRNWKPKSKYGQSDV
ncbi:restriction endonuclease subunit S [Methylobacter luteus]|uniref:restriction endonuclease subunit S n=1 Tax=Methylobacter luteus TaxID=415 RepID=UPI0004170C50|nr:restriction endonuclease subunit S [Methylobacter luteus]